MVIMASELFPFDMVACRDSRVINRWERFVFVCSAVHEKDVEAIFRTTPAAKLAQTK